jgi:sugar phosphate isomerase/epimerase
MVDWTGFLTELARGGFHGPVSLHLEYDIPGSARVKRENTLAAAARDLAFLKAGLARAYAGAGAAPRG